MAVVLPSSCGSDMRRIFKSAHGVAVKAMGAAGLMFILSNPVTAQTSEQAALVQNWQVNCSNSGTPNQLRCSILQVVRLKETGQKVISVEIRRTAGGASKKMLIGLPHGLYLPDGIKLSVDEGPVSSHKIITADAKGSYSEVELNADQLSVLRAGTNLNIGATSRASEPIKFQISLKGFMTSESLLPQ